MARTTAIVLPLVLPTTPLSEQAPPEGPRTKETERSPPKKNKGIGQAPAQVRRYLHLLGPLRFLIKDHFPEDRATSTPPVTLSAAQLGTNTFLHLSFSHHRLSFFSSHPLFR